jgi:hypothetical protein
MRLRLVLTNADLGDFANTLDFNQPPDARMFNIINDLNLMGADESGQQALGRFLNTIINGNYVADQKEKEFIKTLIEKYSTISSSVPKQEELEPPITSNSRVEPIKNDIIKHDQPQPIITGNVIGLENYQTSAVSASIKNLSESKAENIFIKNILEQEGGINETKFELRRIVNVSLTVTEESLIIQAQSAVFVVAKFQTDYNNTFKEIKRYLPDLYEKVSHEYDELCSDIEKLDECFKYIRDKKGMLDSVMKSVERRSVECWRIVRDTIFE